MIFFNERWKKAVFRIKKLNMRFRLVQAQETFVNQAKAVGLGTIML